MRKYYSIFNDVLGPIMTGPSSSHSAGCARIGKTARSLIGREITHADVVFEENGSYPSTYIGQGSNFGFTGGLLGWDTDDPRLKDSVELAKQMGRKISFKKGPLGFHHPNEAEIRVYDEEGNIEMSLLTYSVGGGIFQIVQMDGFDVYIDGGSEQIFILSDSAEASEICNQCLKQNKLIYTTSFKDHSTLYTVQIKPGESCSDLSGLEIVGGIRYVRYAKPVMPVVRYDNEELPFFNAKEAELYSQGEGLSAWELAMNYERKYGRLTEQEVFDLAVKVENAMRASMTPPNSKTTKMYGFLPYQCQDMTGKAKSATLIDCGLINQAALSAIAVMENSCAHNIVVAAPTAGSSGVIPAAIVSVGDQLGYSEMEIAKALLVSGLVGVFIANQATFGAEVAACQAEIGASSCMAAGGVAYLLGCNMQQIFRASSMALQNMMGLVCDPVAGLTEIPCIGRNVSGAANAIMSANMAKLCFDPVIPLDETIQAMAQVGSELPASLRCTCEGGVCKTDTGCKLQKKIDETRESL